MKNTDTPKPASANSAAHGQTPARKWAESDIQTRSNRVEVWEEELPGQHREQICEIYVEGKGRSRDRVETILSAPTLQAENAELRAIAAEVATQAAQSSLVMESARALISAFLDTESNNYEANKICDALLVHRDRQWALHERAKEASK